MYSQEFLIHNNNLTLSVLHDLIKCLKENEEYIILGNLIYFLLDYREFSISALLSDFINLDYNSFLKEIGFISD